MTRWIMTLASVLAFAGVALIATGQEAVPPADEAVPPPDLVALTAAHDAVLARRLLMNAIGSNNDAVHDMLDGVLPEDPYELQSRLAAISAMLRAFPSLYRAAPDPWSAEAEAADPVFVSLALPSVWEEFPAFEAMALQAWQTAQDASLAPKDEVLALVENLEAQCNTCHQEFRRDFEFHDFESLPFPDEVAP